ncbi:MAG: hypothetical protein H0V37_04425 [Chloroflexia bacterium]|nr:hypothetical protein [Chloroflexia bacterium]
METTTRRLRTNPFVMTMDSHNPHHLHVLDSDVWGAWGASMTVDESQLVLILRAIEDLASQITGFGLEASGEWFRHQRELSVDFERVERLSPLSSQPIEIEIMSIGEGKLQTYRGDGTSLD